MLYRGAIKARAALLRHVPARKEPVHFADLPQVRSYPDGYEIAAARDLPRHQVMTSRVMVETVRGPQDQWQAIGLATSIASAVLVGAVLLAAIRPSGRQHGPALLVLLVTLLLASLVVLSVGQSEVALGFEISVLGLGLGVVTVVQAATGATPGPRWRNAARPCSPPPDSSSAASCSRPTPRPASPGPSPRSPWASP